MEATLYLLYFAAFWTDVCSTQATQAALIHIANDAYRQLHQDSPVYIGGATITDSTTIYSVECLASMNGCIKPGGTTSPSEFSFVFSAISSITTYNVGEGPKGDIVECQTSFAPSSALCTRTFTSSGSSSVFYTVSADSGYYTVLFTDLQDVVASAIGATAQPVTPSIITDTVSVSGSATRASSMAPSTSSPSPSPFSSPSGLIMGGNIGVGVGLPIGLIACGLLGFLLYRRRRIKRTGEVQTPELNFDSKNPDKNAVAERSCEEMK